MSKNSKIQWTDHTWPIVSGCTYAAASCVHCSAKSDANRMAGHPNPKVSDVYSGLVEKDEFSGLQWTGVVRPLPARLDWPLKWKQPARIFVCNMADLFHEKVPEPFIVAAFQIMEQADWHRFQVLTKRVDRAGDFLQRLVGRPKNIDFGTSVGSQYEADRVREKFAALPAARKFVSYEPAIGPVNWTGWEFVDQIIAGGESGIKARPSHPAWFRATRDFCQANGIRFFFKQWGRFWPVRQDSFAPAEQRQVGVKPTLCFYPDGKTIKAPFHYSYHGDEAPQPLAPLGKKKSGNLLDGRQWLEDIPFTP